jgi:pimeloyl-ACP methyl ester carboxylesterase
VALHYVTGGSGTPLVLLAGWPQSCYAWRKIMPALAAQYEVFAIDLPGMGDSEQPATGYDTATVARRVHEAVRALGLTDIRLVTHDIGTWVAFAYGHEYPDTLVKLAMMDAAIPGVFAPPPDPKLWHFAFNQQRDLPEALTAGRERIFLSWFFTHRSRVADAISAADLDEYERVYSAPGAMHAGFEFYRAMPASAEQNRVYAACGKLRTPLLVLGSDAPLGPLMIAALANLADNMTGHVICRSGHYLPEEQPEQVLDHLLPFLAAH